GTAPPARARRPPSVALLGGEIGRMGAPKPAERARHVGVVGEVELDPAAPREAAMRPHARLTERPALVSRREPDPEIRLLARQRKAREEARADEVAPAPEHRRDAHAVPRAERTVEPRRRSEAAALQGAARLASFTEAAEASRRGHGGAPFCHCHHDAAIRGASRLRRGAPSVWGGPFRGPPSPLTPRGRHAKTASIRRPSGAGEREPMT